MRRFLVALISATLLGFIFIPAPAAQADTAWDCDTYDSILFDLVGICGELVYEKKRNRHGKCVVVADKVGFFTVGGPEEFERDPAVRIYSIDLLSRSGAFAFSRDDVTVPRGRTSPERHWDPRGTWRSRKFTVIMSYKLYMLGPIRPDKEGYITFNVRARGC